MALLCLLAVVIPDSAKPMCMRIGSCWSWLYREPDYRESWSCEV